MGIEVTKPIYCEKAYAFNFSNEGGYNETYRVLKNLPGMWLFNRLKDEYSVEFSDEALCRLANESEPLVTFIDVEDPLFFNPDSMFDAINQYCLQTNQKQPSSIGDYIRCILEGLAFVYKHTLEQIKEISSKSIEVIHIVGGGSQNELLCQMTSNLTGKPVKSGPVEGTAMGNIMVQAISNGQIESLEQARELVGKSFDIVEYFPDKENIWERAWRNFLFVKNKRFGI